jgi:N-acetylglutamate synthase-like GNAT family acetyltransferase
MAKAEMQEDGSHATAGYTFRDAVPGDGTGIVTVFREAMIATVVEVNVLGTPEAAHFVDRSIVATREEGSDRYWVAETMAGRIVAFAQVRRGLGVAYINNIHVLPSVQGHGIGARLMRLMARAIDTPEVGADVFEGSDVSWAIFQRAGFRQNESYHWHVLEPDLRKPEPYVVHDLPLADAAHAACGLSLIRVETATGMHQVGRIGPQLFRLVGAAALEAPRLGPVLGSIDPARSTLAIVPANEDHLGLSPLLVGRRLQARRSDLIAKYGP